MPWYKNFIYCYFQDVDITDNPLVIIMNEKKELKAHFLVHDKFEETKYEVLSMDELWKQFLHVRLNTVLPLTCEATINGVKNMMQNKRKKVNSWLIYVYTWLADLLLQRWFQKNSLCYS